VIFRKTKKPSTQGYKGDFTYAEYSYFWHEVNKGRDIEIVFQEAKELRYKRLLENELSKNILP